MCRFALLLLTPIAACGTMLNGGPFMVPVNSHPSGATVYYEGHPVGKTPCQVAMHPRDTMLRFSLDGHGSKSVEVPTSINWISPIGNGLLGIPGLVIGLPVDLATGCILAVDTDQVVARFPGAYRKPFSAATPYGQILVITTRSKLHGKMVTVEAVNDNRITVRAVDGGETDTLEAPFSTEIESAKRALEAKSQLVLNCYYGSGN